MSINNNQCSLNLKRINRKRNLSNQFNDQDKSINVRKLTLPDIVIPYNSNH